MDKNDTNVNFLGIGAQKAATSWLWSSLRKHPDIWLPPCKELHYFDRSTQYPSPSHLATAHFSQRIFSSEPNNKQFRKLLLKDLTAGILKLDSERCKWIPRYYFTTYSDEWYLSLFDPGKDKITGEITPSYSILNLEDVQSIKELLPDLKIIFLMRNPIDRAWSQIRFAWTKRDFKTKPNIDQARKFIESPGQTLRSDYLRTLKIWKNCFPENNIFIGFYDDVIKNPGKLLNDIFKFLNARQIEDVTERSKTYKVNVSRKLAMPKEINIYLANKYLPQLQELSKSIGGHTTVWLQQAKKILINK
jgi:hypothetical protein